jgi:hypothetical protein
MSLFTVMANKFRIFTDFQNPLAVMFNGFSEVAYSTSYK